MWEFVSLATTMIQRDTPINQNQMLASDGHHDTASVVIPQRDTDNSIIVN